MIRDKWNSECYKLLIPKMFLLAKTVQIVMSVQSVKDILI